MPHISIQAEKIGEIFGLGITNSILTTWLVMAILIGFGILLSRKLALVPSRGQTILEMIIDGLYGMFKSINAEKVNKFFPLLASLFLFIIVSNWIGLLPGVGTIGLKEEVKNEKLLAEKLGISTEEHENGANTGEQGSDSKHSETFKLVPLFRGPTADLNTTIALALIAVAAIQFFGVTSVGAKFYISKFINFKDPISFFVGILDLIGEFTKIISFSFRLFGNIFAGEVLLTIIAFLIPVIAPMPFLAMEIFIGFIQALVFSMLTAVFLNVATSREH